MPLSPDSLYLEAARRSVSSSSSSTAHYDSSSECIFPVEDNKYEELSVNELKPLPLLPSSYSYNFDPYVIEHPDTHPFQSSIPPLTTISQLAYALGPDNVPHTTEIDTVPCAGIRIPHGPLAGLLAWRLVVRLASSTKEKRGWWNDNTDRRSSYTLPVPVRAYTRPLIISNPSASMSVLSLPPFAQSLPPDPESSYEKIRPRSAILSRQAHTSKPQRRLQTIDHSHLQTPPPLPNALAVNFILDTSLPYSIISRDTLIALGYPPRLIPRPSISTHLANMPPAMITLSIQNISTRFQIARPNEASRLGVQFLHDAGVSVFFPKDGEGVGPVLYVESPHMLKDVPRTISFRKSGIKLSLPQRVRALFGLS